MNRTQCNNVLHYEDKNYRVYQEDLVGEEPLSIRVEGQPYSVVMRTPGEEIFHAAGFCLAEGLVDRPEDFATIGYCKEMDTNVITVTLLPERRKKVADVLERRGFISQTSCGICGKELIQDLYQILKPISDKITITMERAMECVSLLSEHQNLYQKTSSTHGVMLFDSQLNSISMAEDVGRHNALDKAIGKIFLEGKIVNARLAVLSSRISYELIQKAARAQLAILIGMSRPTALAVELGRALNITLASIRKKREFLVFCGEERFKAKRSAII